MYPDAAHQLSYQTEDKVFFFTHAFDPFSNWSAHQVRLWGKTFATAEHAYQYRKFDITDENVAQTILDAPSPWAAFQLSRTYKAAAREDWNEIKVSFMSEILQAKLEQNQDVQDQLRKTGNRQIIENSPWDNFWGGGEDGLGQNQLGKIWMQLRGQLPPLAQ